MPDSTRDELDAPASPIHLIAAFTGGDENIGIAVCGARIDNPNRPTQVGRFTADRSKVTCPECRPVPSPSEGP